MGYARRSFSDTPLSLVVFVVPTKKEGIPVVPVVA
jgi:hypothetical protein